jgi:hypothetical protein
VITVSTRDDKRYSAMKSCAHNAEEDDPPSEPAEGLAFPMLRVLDILALMTCANDGLSTSSLRRDLLRVDMVGDKGVAWWTSKPRQALYALGALGEGYPINEALDKCNSQGTTGALIA